ncbi:hypothetical protein ABMY26_04005 [Azospirillum sp. HJ39]|uniref:hypothetical protein n=1 Tax=Azospirillum sp. HJ39 TaxID=3159496 RepID=UPI0035588110
MGYRPGYRLARLSAGRDPPRGAGRGTHLRHPSAAIHHRPPPSRPAAAGCFHPPAGGFASRPRQTACSRRTPFRDQIICAPARILHDRARPVRHGPVGGRAKIGFRSADHSVSTNLTGAARSGGVDILGSATLRDAGRIRTGDGNGLTNDQQLKSGLFKAGATLDERNRVQVSYQKFSDTLITPSNPGGSDAFGLLQRLERRQDQFTGTYSFRDDGRKC